MGKKTKAEIGNENWLNFARSDRARAYEIGYHEKLWASIQKAKLKCRNPQPDNLDKLDFNTAGDNHEQSHI